MSMSGCFLSSPEETEILPECICLNSHPGKSHMQAGVGNYISWLYGFQRPSLAIMKILFSFNNNSLSNIWRNNTTSSFLNFLIYLFFWLDNDQDRAYKTWWSSNNFNKLLDRKCYCRWYHFSSKFYIFRMQSLYCWCLNIFCPLQLYDCHSISLLHLCRDRLTHLDTDYSCFIVLLLGNRKRHKQEDSRGKKRS